MVICIRQEDIVGGAKPVKVKVDVAAKENSSANFYVPNSTLVGVVEGQKYARNIYEHNLIDG
jgi:hypothetical protein